MQEGNCGNCIYKLYKVVIFKEMLIFLLQWVKKRTRINIHDSAQQNIIQIAFKLFFL